MVWTKICGKTAEHFHGYFYISAILVDFAKISSKNGKSQLQAFDAGELFSSLLGADAVVRKFRTRNDPTWSKSVRTRFFRSEIFVNGLHRDNRGPLIAFTANLRSKSQE